MDPVRDVHVLSFGVIKNKKSLVLLIIINKIRKSLTSYL